MDSGAPDPVREQAIAWLARLRADPTERERAEFEDWYIADPRHADTYDALLDSWEDAALASQVPAARRDPQPAPRHLWARVAVAAAAVLLVLVAGGLVLTNNMRSGVGSDAMLASRVGEIREIVLEDGSRVTLDTNSVAHVTFDGERRRVQLERGRARFVVAHDTRRPFVVVARTSEVVAHGTVFDVDLREREALVSLLQGSVEVRRPAAPGTPARSTMLRPGQQLALGPDRPVAAPVAIRTAETRWPSGMLSFEDVPLGEVVATANRYSRTQIVIGDRAVRGRRFTGTFKAGEPAQLADMVGSMFGLSVRRTQDGNLVLAAAK
jgi:transmembrane sensor